MYLQNDLPTPVLYQITVGGKTQSGRIEPRSGKKIIDAPDVSGIYIKGPALMPHTLQARLDVRNP